MLKREIDLKVLKSAVNAVLDHLVEDLGIESVAIEEGLLLGVSLPRDAELLDAA